MSGHSKWATIKRQKGANDQKRGQVFTKLSNAITVAVRQGGNISDPESNFRLRLAIEAARSENMPKENIERAIARAAGKQDVNLEEVVYEGFGPGGFSVIVEAYTDNKQRTVSEVKNTFDKNGGSMGSQGSVMYQFEKKGSIVIAKDGKSLDDVFMVAVDAGADDVEENGGEIQIYCRPEELARVRSYLSGQGISILSGELVYKPLSLVGVADKTMAERALGFLEKMEDLNDVQKVYANVDLPNDLLI
jgi:YebC/PmpR family DNA-binding regulatory protein